jgi:hypothetical protein
MGNLEQRQPARVISAKDDRGSDSIRLADSGLVEPSTSESPIKSESALLLRKMIFFSLVPIAGILSVFFISEFGIFDGKNPLQILVLPLALIAAFFTLLLFTLSYIPFVIQKNSKRRVIGFLWFCITFVLIYVTFLIQFAEFRISGGLIYMPRESPHQINAMFIAFFIWLSVRATQVFDKMGL